MQQQAFKNASTRLAGVALVLIAVLAAPASAAKITMVFPGPVTTFSLPYLVAQKKGWLGDLQVEDIFVTGDANKATAAESSVSGGAQNVASASQSSISGGHFNQASDPTSSVVGGCENVAGRAGTLSGSCSSGAEAVPVRDLLSPRHRRACE